MKVSDADGYGRYGIVDADTEGLLFHECGNRYCYLGLHVWKAHQIRATNYRAKHGLRRTGLVAEDLRQLMAANAARTMDDRPLFVARRSVEVAKQAVLALEVPHSPAGKEAMRTACAGPRPRKYHLGNTCEECGATFCNLQDRKRRFCTAARRVDHRASSRGLRTLIDPDHVSHPDLGARGSDQGAPARLQPFICAPKFITGDVPATVRGQENNGLKAKEAQ